MNIGDKVVVTEVMELKKYERSTNVVTKQISPIECIYLGKGQRWAGKWQNDNCEYYLDDYWANTKCHVIYKCQPIDKGGRYRKPICATFEGIEKT